LLEKTGWRPDVCTCYLEFEFEREKGWGHGVRVTKAQKCDAHRDVKAAELHEVIWAETRLKSAAIVQMERVTSVLVANGVLVVPWRFVGSGKKRSLSIRAGDMLMESEKAILQTVFDANIGKGRVTVS
jgi:hypothetical protein